jgi:uncharacterized protein YndB with AHSA1/START domain
MISTTEVKMEKDLEHKQIITTLHINAKPEAVWQAWTKKDLLDKWWAPKPWHAETKKLEFKEGGQWQYAMIGPDNQRQNAKLSYKKINAPKSFEATDSFTDEKGFTDDALPQTHWKCEFRSSGAGTDVKITMTPKTEGALEKNLEMGFEQGFKMALGNLEEYFEENK